MLLAVLIVPGAKRINGDFINVYTGNEARNEQALARYIRQLPEDQTAVTTFWPLTGTLDLLAGRRVEVVEDVREALDSGAIVIIHAEAQPDTAAGHAPGKRIGPYAIIRGKE